MLDASYLHNLNQVLASLEDRIELSPAEKLTYFRAGSNTLPTFPNENRGFTRQQFRVRAVLDLRQSLPTIDRERTFHCVYTRDISRTGIGFLHADELYPGEECRLWLPQQERPVAVVHCVRKGRRCYIIGARFCRP
ncbi:MAG: PilZ domain-containing protein [Planctomycetia bacterium]|nr:PilZ domain-containing protein [Planctomycetia bacterium]